MAVLHLLARALFSHDPEEERYSSRSQKNLRSLRRRNRKSRNLYRFQTNSVIVTEYEYHVYMLARSRVRARLAKYRELFAEGRTYAREFSVMIIICPPVAV